MASTPKGADATSDKPSLARQPLRGAGARDYDKPEVGEPLGHAAIDRRGDLKGSGAVKTTLKLSDFDLGRGSIYSSSKWNLSIVDEWSKLDQSQLEKELDKYPLMLPSEREAIKEDITKWKQLTEQEKKKLLRQDKSSRRQDFQRDLSEAIQSDTQYKEAAEQLQRELEEKKASFQQEITLGHLSQTHRRELEAKLSEMEREIMSAKQEQEEYQKQIDHCKQRLQDTSQEQDKDSKRILEEALRKGTILARMNKCILTGSAGTGKTHVMHLLLGMKPPIVRCSTPCAKAPIRVVSTIRIKCGEEGWVVVGIEELENILASIIPVLWDALPEDEKVQAQSFKSLFQHQQSSGVTQGKAAPTSQGRAAPTSQDSPSLPSQDQTTSSISDAPKQATTSLLDDLVKQLNQLAIESTEESEESIDFTNANWIHLIDSGGQPQFYDLFPIFIRHATSILLVQRLCDHLNDRPTVEYYDEKGALVGIPYLSLFTNLETVMCLARTMHSHPTEGKHPKIMLACTHRDMEGKCSETRAEKNKTLFNLLHPLFPDDLVLYGDAMEPIFPLNAKEPDEEDKRVAKLLRQAIESSAPDPVELPLWWYFLEIGLARLATLLGRRILSRKECLSVADNLRFPEEEFDAALQYLDQLNICLYYPDILPDVVFSDPQVPLDKASELVQQSYKLREAKQGKKSQGPQEALEAKWLKFRDQGIVRSEFLEKFPKHYRERLFTPSHLLLLFEHLLIFAPLTKDEYFMPSLLQVVPPEELDKYRAPSSSPAAPLIIHFPHGWPRSGIFCCLVVFLINHCKWQVLLPGTGSPILIARNCVKFRIPRSASTVTLIDSYTNFEVYISAPPSVCRKMCPTIRNLIFDGIDAAATNLRYNNSEPQIAFMCTYTHNGNGQTSSTKPSIPPHAATITEDQEYLECTIDAQYGELTEREKVWLQPGTVVPPNSQSPSMPASTTVDMFAKKPTLTQLMKIKTAGREKVQIIKSLAPQWKELGALLDFDTEGRTLKLIEADHQQKGHVACCQEMFTLWLEGKGKEATWELLIELLDDIDQSELAKRVKAALQL